jgi:hypothetical protein
MRSAAQCLAKAAEMERRCSPIADIAAAYERLAVSWRRVVR